MLSHSCLSPSLAHVSSRSSFDISRGAHIVKLNSHAEFPQRRVVLRRCRCVHALCNTLILDRRVPATSSCLAVVQTCCCVAGVCMPFRLNSHAECPQRRGRPQARPTAFESTQQAFACKILHRNFRGSAREKLCVPTEFLVQEHRI